MRNAIALLSALVSGAFALSANATDIGPYLDGSAGAYYPDIDDTDFEDGAAVAKVFAGYRVHPNLAVEADYQKLYETNGDVLSINTEVNADAWTVALRPTLPLTEVIDVYGKVGYTWYDVEASASAAGLSFAESDSDRDCTWGGGVDFNFRSLSLRGEFSRIEIADADLNLMTAGSCSGSDSPFDMTLPVAQHIASARF